jgi:transposase
MRSDTSMAKETEVRVIGGVDTHKFHPLCGGDRRPGSEFGYEEFPSNAPGYGRLLGSIETIGVECSGSFGASLTRYLRAAGEKVAEVNKPNRQARHMQGKSDRLDAEQIARAVLAGEGVGTPKTKLGPVEVIQMLRVARAIAIRPRTQAFTISSAR